MKELEVHRVYVKFCCKLGQNFKETFKLLNLAYREDCMSLTQCYEWFKRFKEGRMSVGEDPRPGWLSTSTNDDHVDRGRAVICDNRRLTVREVADEVGISIESCHQIFTDELQMRRVSAKFVPLFWLTIRKRTVLKPVRNSLPMQMVMKTFLRRS